MEKAIKNLKKWLVKKKLVNPQDKIGLAKKDLNTTLVYRNEKPMGTGFLNTEKKMLENFKFLRTENSSKPLYIVKTPTPKELRTIRYKKEYTLGDFVKTKAIIIKGL
jgi:hypothetical protein